jgi:hypothetical protein
VNEDQPENGRTLDTYRQPEKERVRQRILRHAVDLLTQRRAETPIVRPGELRAVVDYAADVLAKLGRSDLDASVHDELDRWLEWQASRVQQRKPAELRLIYLCGPEPLNDLRVLLELGVNPHNVWGVESNEVAFRAALEELANAGLPVKLHKGTLAQFFERVPETFDIAYLDTTGPILGGKPAALSPTLELLRASRLEPLSVLITNFANVPEPEIDRYGTVMTDYFRFRFNDVPQCLLEQDVDPAWSPFDSTHMLQVVKSNMQPVYSDFITRLVVDLARHWIPSARGFQILERQYLADTETARSTKEAAYSPGKAAETATEILESVGDALLSPNAYPLVSFLRSMRESNSREPLIQQLGEMQFFGRSALELNRAVALLDGIAEGHWKMASQELLQAIAAPWFDRRKTYESFTCDLPFPNLLVHSLLGIYGRPCFYSARDSIRGRYTAKSTEMFTDLFVLDQCRYYFDWFPTVPQAPSRFRSHAFQVLARCLLDRIWSSERSPDAHPFRGSSVAGFNGLADAPFHTLPGRESWA